MKHLFLLFILGLNTLATYGKEAPGAAPAAFANKHAPLSFIENKGQITDQDNHQRKDIQFKLTAAPGLSIFIGEGSIHYQFRTLMKGLKDGDDSYSKKTLRALDATKESTDMYRLDVTLVGANEHAQVITEGKQAYYENYFTAATGGESVTAYAYNKITYKDVYPHIDWVLYVNNGKLEHEFIVNEGGNAGDIKLSYWGATDLVLNADGSLTATAPQGTITEVAPVAYEADGKRVTSAFKLTGNELSYETGNYTGKLTIDPTIVWGTYYGGSGEEYAWGITTDRQGNVYIAGETQSASNIATSGSYQVLNGGGSEDAFIAKFNSAGTILWASYYGGSGTEYAYGIAIDTAGWLYITGMTGSTTGIATPGAYQTTYGGGTSIFGDAFLAKFSSSGAIQWATYYGGIMGDIGNCVATDKAGNVYVGGSASSSTGVATTGAYDTTYAGGTFFGDAFLAKFTSTGELRWATYYGGSGEDIAYGVATDPAGNVILTGQTVSTTGIATHGAYDTAYAGGSMYGDVFVAKFDSLGAIQWGTYYGASGDEYSYAIATDGAANVFITGYTTSTDSIATTGAYDTTGNGANNFLIKFNSEGVREWATYYSISTQLDGCGVATDGIGDVFITGGTLATTGIATAGAYQATYAGGTTTGDAFLTQFSGAGALLYGTYYGGASDDVGLAIAVDDSGNVYFSGATFSTSAIATAGAYQVVNNGNRDAFVAKFSSCMLPATGTITGLSAVCADSSIAISDAVTGGVWTVSNGVATLSSGVLTGVTAGMDTVMYVVTNTCAPAVAEKIITVNDCSTTAVATLIPVQLSVYPNPAQDNITIASPTLISHVVISNLVGQAVFAGSYHSNIVTIDLSRLPGGVYVVKVDGVVYRVVKE